MQIIDTYINICTELFFIFCFIHDQLPWTNFIKNKKRRHRKINANYKKREIHNVWKEQEENKNIQVTNKKLYIFYNSRSQKEKKKPKRNKKEEIFALKKTEKKKNLMESGFCGEKKQSTFFCVLFDEGEVRNDIEGGMAWWQNIKKWTEKNIETIKNEKNPVTQLWNI